MYNRLLQCSAAPLNARWTRLAVLDQVAH